MKLISKHNYMIPKGDWLVKLEKSVSCSSCSGDANYQIKNGTNALNICGSCLKQNYTN